MNSDEERSDDYWEGVLHALRMVDSFLKWSKRNEARAKPLEQFIHDGLIAAAKRCQSCLSKKLGVAFSDEDETTEEVIDQGPDIELVTEGDDSEAEISLVTESELESSIEEREEIEPMTIDSMDSSSGSINDELKVDGETRDFTSDFDLVEPSPLIVESSDEHSESPPSEEFDEPIETSTEKEPAFTWREYEEELTPDDDLPVKESEPAPDIPTLAPAPPEPPASWSSVDEPSVVPDTPESDSDDSDENKLSDDPKPLETPPPPPPPPEPEESDEERRRRARRLFFGA